MTTTWNSRNLNPNNVLDVILTGYWNDSATWDDTKIWNDTGGQTSFTTRSIPNTSWNGRAGLQQYQYNAHIAYNEHIRYNGDRTSYTTRIIP